MITFHKNLLLIFSAEIEGLGRHSPYGISVRQPRQKPLADGKNAERALIIRGGFAYLNAKPVPPVLARPVFTLVREPVIWCRVDAFTLVCCKQLIHIRYPHRSP